MNTAWLTRARDLMFPMLHHGYAQPDSSVPERMPLPHTFKPRLRFAEAVVAVMGAFLRIFLGSLIFAVWGTYSLAAWSEIRNPFLRAAALLPLFTLFLLTFGAMLAAIGALVRACAPKRS